MSSKNRRRNVPNYSEMISQFIKAMDDAKRDYQWSYDEVGRMDLLTQDYLHKLELDGLDYKERAKVATKLATCRQKRREYKNVVLALEPLIAFLETAKGESMLNTMKEVLGKTRKAESHMKHAVYVPRVLGGDTDETK